MGDQEEIKELLREIRDIQKAHFERYQEFTAAALARQQAAGEETERARSEQRRFREEIRRSVEDTEARLKSGSVLRLVVLGVAVGAAVLAVGAALLAVLLRAPGP
jgi:anti-sigma-K factor RskA